MKQVAIIIGVLICRLASAQTNTLALSWIQPPGYQSTLYESTNLTGTWMPLGVVSPPITTLPTNPVAFFYVSVAPSNTVTEINGGETYVSDPNSEHVTPRFPGKPDYSYDPNGFGPIYVWNIASQIWN